MELGSPRSGKQHRAERKEIWEGTRQIWKRLWTRELLRELLGMGRNLKYVGKIQHSIKGWQKGA